MQNVKREITKEEYLELKNLPYKEQEERLFPDGIPAPWACGYGYYGHHIYRGGDGKYYASFDLGSTMD